VSVAAGIARDNFTTLQARTSEETAVATSKGLPVYPKDNYFMEDFVNENATNGGFKDVQKFL
jgi:hypothetical protein